MIAATDVIEDLDGRRPLMTVRQVARHLHVSEVTIRRLIGSGRLRSIRLTPRAVRIRPEDIEMLMSGAETT